MMEIPTAVAASSTLRLGTGTIDLLARTGRGTGRFLICELKEPNARVGVYEALVQAIRYAAALDFEIKGNDLLGPADFGDYRLLFGASGSGPLRFGAMAIMSARPAEEIGAAFDRLALSPGGRRPWLGVMMYMETADRLVAADRVYRA